MGEEALDVSNTCFFLSLGILPFAFLCSFLLSFVNNRKLYSSAKLLPVPMPPLLPEECVINQAFYTQQLVICRGVCHTRVLENGACKVLLDDLAKDDAAGQKPHKQP